MNIGADKAYDTRDFVHAVREMSIRPFCGRWRGKLFVTLRRSDQIRRCPLRGCGGRNMMW
jgi:hypothetical protein